MSDENAKITTHESVNAVIYRKKDKENTPDPEVEEEEEEEEEAERIHVEGDKS